MNIQAITALYNPCGYRRINDNYRRWVARYPLPVLTVELSFDGTFISDPQTSIQLQGEDRHRLWQKEALLNYGVSQLPADVDVVAWVDCDLLPFSDDLGTEIETCLQRALVVQLFRRNFYLGPTGLHERSKPGSVVQQTMCTTAGAPGGAWACRRETFEAFGGLYDRDIIGGGDQTALCGFRGHRKHYAELGGAWQQDVLRWIDRTFATVQSRLDYARTDIYHLWHGTRRNRQYGTRWQPLAGRYDPRSHVVDDGGKLSWTDAAPQDLRAHVAQYFLSRRDDG